MNNYESLKEGDIVWANRYKTEREKKRIPEGHRDGPFIVMRRTPKRVFAIMVTGSHVARSESMKFHVSNESFTKESYVVLPGVWSIGRRNFVKKIGEMSCEGMKRIERFLYLYSKKHPEIKLLHCRVPKNSHKMEGDILKKGSRYFYVSRVEDELLWCHEIYKTDKSPKAIAINSSKYSFNLSGFCKFSNSEALRLVNVAPERVIENVREREEIFARKEKTRCVVREGKIVKWDNGYGYVYAMDEKYFYMYKVLKKKTSKSAKIGISGKSYRTNFDKVVVLRSEDVQVVGCASLKEQIEIKSQIKNHTKKKSKARVYVKKKKKKYILIPRPDYALSLEVNLQSLGEEYRVAGCDPLKWHIIRKVRKVV